MKPTNKEIVELLLKIEDYPFATSEKLLLSNANKEEIDSLTLNLFGIFKARGYHFLLTASYEKEEGDSFNHKEDVFATKRGLIRIVRTGQGEVFITDSAITNRKEVMQVNFIEKSKSGDLKITKRGLIKKMG